MTPFTPSPFPWLFYFAMNGFFVVLASKALDGLPFQMSSGIFQMINYAIDFNFPPPGSNALYV
jgi:hypothetical protein